MYGTASSTSYGHACLPDGHTGRSTHSACGRADSAALCCYSAGGRLPAARVTDMCVCVGPPDVIALGKLHRA